MGETAWFEGVNDPGAGDLAALPTLQRALADTADAARWARTDLQGLHDQVTDAIWQSDAAEEFRASVQDDVLGDLARLEDSYAPGRRRPARLRDLGDTPA